MANEVKESMKQEYESPELFELGEAKTLTLGTTGCGEDETDCQHKPDPPSPF